MTSFVENFQNFSDLQKQGLEPVRDFTGFAIDAFEKVARQSYAVYGDLLDFALTQARLPLDVSDPKDYFDRQVSEGKAFVSLLTESANEFVTLGNSLRESSATLFEKDVVGPAPAKKATKAAPKKAA